jgi:subtilisin family serine protease
MLGIAMDAAGVTRRKALSIGTLLTTLMACGVAAAQTQSEPLAEPTAATRTVTLITGDQVVIRGGEKQSVTVIPRKGREGIVFSTTYQNMKGRPESLLVIPSDAQPLIDADRLDRKLFDVTTLLESNDDDGTRLHLPLVVTYDPQVSMARAASTSLAGAAITGRFESVNGVAAKATKKELGRFWDTLTGRASSAGSVAALAAQNGSIRKIWLDRVYKPHLQQSVPQIGAPLAWQSGYDGTGITVGVIDTGLDTSHPDLVGKTVLSKAFTDPETGESAVFKDEHGHGTHVAGIIVGSGAGAGGKYRGVAPGAQLAIFDACGTVNGGFDGCRLSTILEGVHWMAEQRIKIINMSLGTGDTPEVDPLEEAIQRLSEQYGLLYVISTGNSGGNGPYTVESPGSTPAALTVGAVDKSDQMAAFSSRGPLPAFGGYLLKPDITAPGDDIVSARASEGSDTGVPIDVWYMVAGGTSMAAPHVAGAAAILLQRYPHWSGKQLKSALMGSARFNPAATFFDQGAGRVDVPAALATIITSEPASVSLGFAEFPHDDDEIVTRTVTYRNESAAPQSLTLRLDMTGPDGAPPPAGMLSLDRTTLSLPAGGTATVTVTANTRLPAAFGWFTGKLLATGASTALSIPVILHREQPMYSVSLRHIDRNGAEAEHYTTTFVPIDRCMEAFPAVSGVKGNVALRMPVARYAVQAHFQSNLDGDPVTLLLYGDFAHNAASTLTLDARNAPLVTNTPPTATAVSIWRRAEYAAATACGDHAFGLEWSADGETSQSQFYAGFLGEPAQHIRAYVSEQWRDAATANSTDGPALYAAAFSEPGVLLTGPRKILTKEMSAVRARYASTIDGAPNGRVIVGVDVPGPSPQFGTSVNTSLPLTRTEYYYSTDQNVRWHSAMSSGLDLSAPAAKYEPLSAYMTRWNDPPYAPALPNYNPEVLWSYRVRDAMTVEVPILGDRGAHVVNLSLGDEDSATSVLYRNGARISQRSGSCTTCLIHRLAVPPELATYRIESQVTQSILPLSTRVSGAWTFQSQQVATGETTQLPLITVQYKPMLNARGEAARDPAFKMPLSVHQLDSQGPARVRDLTIEASFDDGVSWKRVSVERQAKEWIATLQHPLDAEYVSLRATAEGLSANTAQITVIRAYALAVPPAR